MSVGAAVTESYWTDPLTLAAKALVDSGVVVVAAAGNIGKNAHGQLQCGGIVAPGNAPWVLTVGASSTKGTLTRRGRHDGRLQLARSDLRSTSPRSRTSCAPGVGTVSLAAPGSTLFQSTCCAASLLRRHGVEPVSDCRI